VLKIVKEDVLFWAELTIVLSGLPIAIHKGGRGISKMQNNDVDNDDDDDEVEIIREQHFSL